MQENRVRTIIFLSIPLIIIIYFLTGIYSLQTGQGAVIIRFGRIIEEVHNSGIHYCLPRPIEKPIKLQASKVQTISIQETRDTTIESFTGDENLLVAKATISYDIKNLSDYIFISDNIKLLIQTASQMCLARELTSMTVDDAMTKGKSLLRLVIKEKLQKIMDDMELGVRLISVELTDISPPQGVNNAFMAVSNARVKKQEIIKDAEGFANQVIPKARADASSYLSEAKAHAREVLNKAEGNTYAFDELLKEYRKNPANTRNMKLLETMKIIFNRCEITIDTNPSQSLYYIN